MTKKYYYLRVMETGQFYEGYGWDGVILTREIKDAQSVEEDLSDLSNNDIEEIAEQGTIELVTVVLKGY